MKRKFLIGLLIVALSLFCFGIATANESQLIQTEQIKSQPVNLAIYIDNQIDYWAEILTRLLKTGKPIILFGEGVSKTGLSITAIENILMDKANLVIGTTILNDEPAQFFWGIEVDIELSGTLGEIFSRFKPAIYVVDGKFLWGFGFELRPEQ